PGVQLLLTAAETAHLGHMPCVVGVPGVDIPVPPCPVLAADEVHHVGDAVAFVVADTLDQARDAAEKIEIAWEPLPHVINAEAALKPGAPQVWPSGNLSFEKTFGDKAGTEAAFAGAAKVVSLKVVN